MSECRHNQDLIEDLIAGEIAEEELKTLHEHCAECTDCAELVDMHMHLLAAGSQIPEPGQGELRSIREGVMARLEKRSTGTREQGASGRPGFRRELASLGRRHPIAAIAATLLVAVCAGAAGRWSSPAPVFDDALMMKAIRQQAARETSLDEYWDSPFSYSNVAVRSESNGEIALSFDVNRHVELSMPRSSPLAREVLLNAILEPSSLGARFSAMEQTLGISDTRLKDAMVLTMQSDPSLAVRLNALSVLTRYPYDAQIEEALLKTVSSDPEVQMRLLAVEYLAAREVGIETIRGAVGDDGTPADRAILQQVSLRSAGL